MSDSDTIIVGAGPAGLTTAYELSKHGLSARIVEADQLVGGISRTVDYKGFKFDIGGHRFFSKVDYVNQLWMEILEDDLLTRPRLSRIFYDGHYFDYPLKALNALTGLGPVESLRVCLSFARSRLFPHQKEETLEEWVSNRFGRRLYQIFFKTYTEKVWGISCKEISSDWAAQRIKNFSLAEALRSALLGSEKSNDGTVITTLIEQFLYPRLGPGMMWERCAELVEQSGSRVELGSKVVQIQREGNRVTSVSIADADGRVQEQGVQNLISSMPLRELVFSINPPPPQEVLDAARRLRYRDYLTVVLIVDVPDVFPDNWIYIHDPAVRMGRIQNYKNWSPEMVPNSDQTALGLEYFLWQDDDEWSWDEGRLIELGIRECEQIGLLSASSVVDGTVVRMKKAYPVYDHEYHECVGTIRSYLDRYENLQTVGRNGLHRYNNQDHSMMTGVLAARNLALAEDHDVWTVNTEKSYHETAEEPTRSRGDRLVPKQIAEVPLLAEAFAKLHAPALGVAIGLTTGLVLLIATVALILKGGDVVGPNLALLGEYLYGYTVSWTGAIVGFIEAGILGFAMGYFVAVVRNVVLKTYLVSIRRRVELKENPDLLDKV